MRYFLLLVALSTAATSFAQTLSPGQDTSLCPGQQVSFLGTVPDSSQLILLQSPTIVNVNDDEFSGLINIGFNFTFYNNTYSQAVVGSNGLLSFNAAVANTYCTWSTGGMPLPNSTFHKNAIFAPFIDMLDASVIRYETIGTAPNRRFVLQFLPQVSLCPGACWSGTIVLHETTNLIDIFIKDMPSCGGAFEGTHNSTGTAASVVPVSGPSGNSAKRWTPNGATSYTLSTIPFQFVLDANFQFAWDTSTGATWPYAANVPFVVTGTNSPIVITLSIQSPGMCGGSPFPIDMDTYSTVTPLPFVNLTGVSQHNETCFGEADGSYAFNISTASPAPHTIYWNGALTTDQSFTGLAPGTYPLQVTDNNGCAYNGTVTITGIAAPLAHTTNVTDGSASGSPELGIISISASGGTAPYQYSIGGAFQSSGEFDSLEAGTYTCMVLDANGCLDSSVVQVQVTTFVSVEDADLTPVTLYPNPVEQLLHLDGVANGCLVTLTDLNGKVCLSLVKSGATIDLHKLKAGVYLLKIEQGERLVHTQRVVKR